MNIRQIDLLIGNESGGVHIVTQGRAQDIPVSFTVTKSVDSTMNKADIVISNLNHETETVISKKETEVELRCGWLNSETGIQLVHKGTVKTVDPFGNTTRVISADGGKQLFEAVTERNYSGKYSLKDVVIDLAGDINGVALGTVNVDGKIGAKGRYLVGSTQDCLNQLAHQFGFTWSIQDGVFQAFDDEKSTERVYIFTDSNIEQIKKKTGQEAVIDKVYQLVTYLDPRVTCGDKIEIRSNVRSEFNGVYIVTMHTMNGDSHADNWRSTIEMKIYK